MWISQAVALLPARADLQLRVIESEVAIRAILADDHLVSFGSQMLCVLRTILISPMAILPFICLRQEIPRLTRFRFRWAQLIRAATGRLERSVVLMLLRNLGF